MPAGLRSGQRKDGRGWRDELLRRSPKTPTPLKLPKTSLRLCNRDGWSKLYPMGIMSRLKHVLRALGWILNITREVMMIV